MSIAFHTSRDLDPLSRGREFGEAQSEAVANTVGVYRRMLGEAVGLDDGGMKDLGAQVGHALSGRYGEVVAEIEGIAAGAGQSAEALLAINARTELLANSTVAPECSVIAIGPSETSDPSRCIVGQTWDWHPALLSSRVCWTVHSDERRWFTTLTEAGILAKIGLNSDGLCCCLNFLSCSADGGVGGVPIHVLLRLVLERSASMVDALALLLNARVTASSCITLGYAEPGGAATASIELSPGGARLVWPDVTGRLVHTNHFLEPPPDGTDLGPLSGPDTYTRYEALRVQAVADAAPTDIHRALSSHFGAPRSICRHLDESEAWPDWRATLLAVVMEPGRGTLQVVRGAPCEGPLEQIELPSMTAGNAAVAPDKIA